MLTQKAANNYVLVSRKNNVEYAKRRRAAGLCVISGCSRPLTTKYRCDYHEELQKENRRRYRAGLSKKVCAPGEINEEKAMRDYVNNVACGRKREARKRVKS